MRRARRLYGGREAVVDGATRFTYAQFFERCDRWSAALQALGVGKGDRVAYISPNTHAQLESFYAVPQIGAVLVPINFRLSTEEFQYLIDAQRRHGGLRRRRLPGRGGRHPPGAARRAPLRGVDRIAGRLARLRGAGGRSVAGARAARHRRARPADHQLHQRHDVAAQGRDDHPPQRLGERARHAGPRADDGRRHATCGRCRCSTPTAGRSRGSSPPSAGATSACPRWTPQRSSG